MDTKPRGKDVHARRTKHLASCLALIGRPYKLGGHLDHDERGLDCLGLVREYIWRMTKYELPLEHDGKPIKSYYDLYKSNKHECMYELRRYLREVLVYEHDVYNTIATDILYIKSIDESETYALGINVGNAVVLTVTAEQGTTFSSLSAFSLQEYYKCPQQSH